MSSSLFDFTILIITSWWPSSDFPLKGIFIREYANRVKKIGFKVTVIAPRISPKDRKYEIDNGLKVIRVDSIFKEVLRIILSRKKCILQVFIVNKFGSICTLIGKLLNRPVIIWTRRSDVLPDKSLDIRILRLLALLVADRIVAVSNDIKQLTLKCGASEKKVSVVYNAVNDEIFKSRSMIYSRKKLGLPLDYDIILSVCAILPRKGLEYLIRSIKIIEKERSNMLLIIVGPGNFSLEAYAYKQYLKKINKNLKLDKVVNLVGRKFWDELTLYYNAADLFVLPTLHEGHSNAILEAMASGLPIVTTSVGGNVDTVVDEKNGYLVPPKDVGALSEAISRILRDEELQRSFGEMSIKLIKERFSVEKQLKEMLKIYQSVVR